MKVFDSDMPEEIYWSSLFDIPLIIDWLKIKNIADPIVEIGCGYGTFTVPVAREVHSPIYTFDIEPAMIKTARSNVLQAGLTNIQFFLRDILEEGTGLESNSIGMVLLFNILHFNERRILLEEANRILKPGGLAAIIHWRKDIETPRGPRIHLRPDLETILDSIKGLDLYFNGNSCILDPYHWGMQLTKGINK